VDTRAEDANHNGGPTTVAAALHTMDRFLSAPGDVLLARQSFLDQKRHRRALFIWRSVGGARSRQIFQTSTNATSN